MYLSFSVILKANDSKFNTKKLSNGMYKPEIKKLSTTLKDSNFKNMFLKSVKKQDIEIVTKFRNLKKLEIGLYLVPCTNWQIDESFLNMEGDFYDNPMSKLKELKLNTVNVFFQELVQLMNEFAKQGSLRLEFVFNSFEPSAALLHSFRQHYRSHWFHAPSFLQI